MASSNTCPNVTAIEQREGHFEGEGGAELFYQTWATKNPRATLVVTHGIAEHSDCYARFAETMVRKGWCVCAWDLRGHGRSAGKRGYVEAFDLYGQDLGFFLKVLEQSGRLKQGFVLVGHSMGGLITLRHLLGESPVDQIDAPIPSAVALSGPALGFSIEVPPIKNVAARVFNRIWPSITLRNEIKYSDLSRDTELLKGYPTDPLRHDKISPAVYLGMIESFVLVKRRADQLLMPILLQAAGQERVVSLPAIREYFDLIGSKNKELIVYNESYHEIFNDLDREKVLDDLHVFLSGALKWE